MSHVGMHISHLSDMERTGSVAELLAEVCGCGAGVGGAHQAELSRDTIRHIP